MLIGTLVVTGAVLAAPVPVLSVSNGEREIVVPLAEGDPLVYSYRQSIYTVPVYEEFVRAGDGLDLLRVRSPDIRSVEYFRWEGAITRDAAGLWTETAPANTHTELVIRVTSDGEQRISTPGWSVPLLETFGEAVVRVRPRERPRLAMALGLAR